MYRGEIVDESVTGEGAEPAQESQAPSIAETQVAFETFLAALEKRDPGLGDVRLQADVNALLGRRAEPVPPARRRGPSHPLVLDQDETERDGPSEFDWYARLVSLVPPIDDESVVAAAQAIEVGLFAQERLDSLDRSKATRREIIELRALIDEGKSQFDRLVLSNVRLVFHWSKGVARSVDPDWAQDAFQVGCIGLMRGLQGWDYALGYKLSTFVSWHIRQSIQRWRVNDIMLIRVPVHVWEGLDRNDGSLSPDLVAAAERAQSILSLDEMDGDDETLAWDGGIDQALLTAERARIVEKLLASLSERESDILKLRHGLGEEFDEPQTLDTIGAMFGVTRERIRQIEKKALDKLRELVVNPGDWIDPA